jgi:hypothetical protein
LYHIAVDAYHSATLSHPIAVDNRPSAVVLSHNATAPAQFASAHFHKAIAHVPVALLSLHIAIEDHPGVTQLLIIYHAIKAGTDTLEVFISNFDFGESTQIQIYHKL